MRSDASRFHSPVRLNAGPKPDHNRVNGRSVRLVAVLLAQPSEPVRTHARLALEDGKAPDEIESVIDLEQDLVVGSVLEIVHEDSRTGGIGESLAAIIQEEAFESLDAPVRVLGALDTPVPYSPPLEDYFLPSEADVERAARLLVAY